MRNDCIKKFLIKKWSEMWKGEEDVSVDYLTHSFFCNNDIMEGGLQLCTWYKHNKLENEGNAH